MTETTESKAADTGRLLYSHSVQNSPFPTSSCLPLFSSKGEETVYFIMSLKSPQCGSSHFSKSYSCSLKSVFWTLQCNPSKPCSCSGLSWGASAKDLKLNERPQTQINTKWLCCPNAPPFVVSTVFITHLEPDGPHYGTHFRKSSFRETA